MDQANAATALFQALLAGLVIGHVIPDHGLVATHDMSLAGQIGVQVTIQALYGATFLIARTTVRQSEAAFIQLDRAVRAIAQREAMLDEARVDLGRVLRIEGPGRYSEQTLGSYRLGVVIERGAMGEVYEAVHIQTDQTAAVKLLHPHIAARPDSVARMLREERAVASLNRRMWCSCSKRDRPVRRPFS